MAKLASMPVLRYVSLLFLVAVLALSCKDQRPQHADSPTSGSIDISVDETYRPVIEEELKVFRSQYPNADIRAHYKPESECIRDLFDNKARLILVPRDLTEAERARTKKLFRPSSLAIARDAIAVIVHPGAPDSILSIEQLQGILTGKYKKPYTVVFDNEGSSMVRYITDSILGGGALGANVYAAKGNAPVVDYVAANPDAIGFIGLSYISDPSDTASGEFLKQIRVVRMQNPGDRKFYKPYQQNIANKAYPLTRDLFFISRENHPGLGTGFANFLSKDSGQLILHQANLFPLRISVVFREAEINTRRP